MVAYFASLSASPAAFVSVPLGVICPSRALWMAWPTDSLNLLPLRVGGHVPAPWQRLHKERVTAQAHTIAATYVFRGMNAPSIWPSADVTRNSSATIGRMPYRRPYGCAGHSGALDVGLRPGCGLQPTSANAAAEFIRRISLRPYGRPVGAVPAKHRRTDVGSWW
jgi:hypothetical protein